MKWMVGYVKGAEALEEFLNSYVGPPGNDHTGPYWSLHAIYPGELGYFTVVLFENGND